MLQLTKSSTEFHPCLHAMVLKGRQDKWASQLHAGQNVHFSWKANHNERQDDVNMSALSLSLKHERVLPIFAM